MSHAWELLVLLALAVLARPATAQLDTCDGAVAKFIAIEEQACPGSRPSTCGNTACAAAISSIDVTTLSSIKTGFTACGALPDGDPKKSWKIFNTSSIIHIYTLTMLCGLPTSTMKLPLPALDTCDGAVARYLVAFG
jgi:hypothetical protein